MSARYFCDVCETELSGERHRIKRKLGDISVEIMVAYKHVWNDGHFCDACVLKAANEGTRLT